MLVVASSTVVEPTQKFKISATAAFIVEFGPRRQQLHQYLGYTKRVGSIAIGGNSGKKVRLAVDGLVMVQR